MTTQLIAKKQQVRICSVAQGSVRVSMHGTEFQISANGMFEVGLGVTCSVANTSEESAAVVHVTAVPLVDEYGI